MVETEAEHPAETTEVVPPHREEPLLVQPIDSDRESALEDHALDRPRAREEDPGQCHWEELHALEDRCHAEAHEEATRVSFNEEVKNKLFDPHLPAAELECYAADRPDWQDTPDSGATLHGTTCTRAPCPCSESPESFE